MAPNTQQIQKNLEAKVQAEKDKLTGSAPPPNLNATANSNATVKAAARRVFVDYLPVAIPDNIEYFIKGKDYCESLLKELGTATEFVYLTGLHFMKDFQLDRRDPESRLSTVLAKLVKKNPNLHVFLLVNQFWTNEYALIQGRESDWFRNKVIGSVDLYLQESMDLFKSLENHPDFGDDASMKKRVHCFTDIHPGSFMHSNHQKTVVIDGRVAFLGGIDLTFIDGDRWDQSHDNLAIKAQTFYRNEEDQLGRFLEEKYWHDIHMKVTGKKLIDVMVDNFQARCRGGELYKLREVAVQGSPPDIVSDPVSEGHKDFPVFTNIVTNPFTEPADYPEKRDPSKSGDAADILAADYVQIVRSMPDQKWNGTRKPAWNLHGRKWECSCREAYVIGIQAARKYIYLENQWITDDNIWNAVLNAARNATFYILNQANKKDKELLYAANFKVVVMLPAKVLAEAGKSSEQTEDISGFLKELYGIFENYRNRLRGDKKLLAQLKLPQDVLDDILLDRQFGIFCIKSNWTIPNTDKRPAASGSPLFKDQSKWQFQNGCIAENQVYVHSKILLIDDQWLLVGSANAGGISLTGSFYVSEPDTEISAILFESKAKGKVLQFRKDLFAGHSDIAPATGQEPDASAPAGSSDNPAPPEENPLVALRTFWAKAETEFSSKKNLIRFHDMYVDLPRSEDDFPGKVLDGIKARLSTCTIGPIRKYVLKARGPRVQNESVMELGFSAEIPSLDGARVWLSWAISGFDEKNKATFTAVKLKTMQGKDPDVDKSTSTEIFATDAVSNALKSDRNKKHQVKVVCRMVVTRFPCPKNEFFFGRNVVTRALVYSLDDLAAFLEMGTAVP